MPNLVTSSIFQYPHEAYFTLFIKRSHLRTLIQMQVKTSVLNTKDLPATLKILGRYLPGVLSSKCFNDSKLPFFQEVQNTEIGHLFEHILLEYLCELKIAKGFEDVIFSGVTDWNWYRDPRGMFHISITSGVDDSDIFPIALEKTIELMNKILTSSASSLALN